MTERCCKTCRHWDVKAAEDERGQVSDDAAALCRWVGVNALANTALIPYWLAIILRDRWRPMQLARSGHKCRAWAARDD